ncbi:MAG: restriction endonuclease subunit S [Moheibacter sp.]
MVNKQKDIPKHWKWVTLDEVSVTSSGGTPDRKNSNYFRGDIPWVKSGELNYNVITQTEEYITQEAVDYSSAKVFPKGSLLIALYGNTVGRMAFLGIDATTNQAVASIKSFCINPKYLYYFLISSKDELLNKREGSAQPNISQKVLNSFPFPLAPIDEQNRIVEKIEELFSELEYAKKHLNNSLIKLEYKLQKTLRQCFLNVKGKDYKLSEIAEWGTGGTPSRKINSYFNGTIPWVKTQELKNKYITKTEEYLTVEGLENSNAKIYPKGSIVVAMYGATVGKLSILNIDACTNQACAVGVINDLEYLNIEFLYYYLLTHKENLISQAKGGAQQNISLSIIKNMIITVPDIKEQNKTVESIGLLNMEIESQKKNIKEELKRTETLYQKILQEAFQGKLVNQLNTDTSTDILLKNIQKEKEEYSLNQQEIIKNRPKIRRMKKEKLSIIQVLEKNKNPISAKQLWEDSMYSDSIEKFYSELKKVQDRIIEEKTEKGSLISLK